MKQKQITLSIEQMKHLEDLGLDASDASMCYIVNIHINPPSEGLMLYNKDFAYQIEGHDIIPSYTLQDILSILPCSIEEDEIGRFDYDLKVTMMCDGNGYLSYETQPSEICDEENDPLFLHETECKNILDSAFDMLLWCIENNYIKTNKE